jgi:dipeptidyl aminopeptidase/acylaminoacyl peptidase
MHEVIRYSHREHPVQLTAGFQTLSGNLTLPESARGLVLFAHGSGSSRFSPRNRYVAGVLNQAGLGTLLFDLLTEPEEAEDSLSQEHRFNIGLLADRLAGATDWVIAQPETKDLNIGYFGASTGAAAALMAAGQRRAQVDAIVSRGGRPDLAGPFLKNVTAPTLLIVGSEDHEVIQLNRHAFQQLQCEKEMLLVSGATHLFEEPGTLESVAEAASQWFTKHLNKPRHVHPVATR